MSKLRHCLDLLGVRSSLYLVQKKKSMELEDSRSGVDNMVVQVKPKIVDISIQILKLKQ